MTDPKEKDLQLIQDLTYEQQRLAGELQQILTNTRKLKLDLRTDQKCGEAWDKTKVKWHSFLSNHSELKAAAPERDIAYFQNDKIKVTKQIVIAIQDVLKNMDPVGIYEVPGGPLINVLEDVIIPENPDGEVEAEEQENNDGSLLRGPAGESSNKSNLPPRQQPVNKGAIPKLPFQDLNWAVSVEKEKNELFGGGMLPVDSTSNGRQQQNPPNLIYGQNGQQQIPPFHDGYQNRAHYEQWRAPPSNHSQQQMSGNGGPFNPQPSQQPPEVDWITRLVTGMNANNREIITQLQGQARNPAPDYGRGLQIPKIEVPIFAETRENISAFVILGTQLSKRRTLVASKNWPCSNQGSPEELPKPLIILIFVTKIIQKPGRSFPKDMTMQECFSKMNGQLYWLFQI